MTSGLAVGLAAHVDAGKTTLSESMLFLSGALRRQGRVDHGDTFLDTDRMEKERGITIFSKEARLLWKKTPVTLPFSARIPVSFWEKRTSPPASITRSRRRRTTPSRTSVPT